ncbi:yrdC domain-containing protein, mitochondrial-like [Actinia tenebrosa]|uniref:Threonylcarbamoyl-AMP synthase n=1 Tax=Actinia tenebrosa TaxID=6105 RepID=A0A6P8IDF4_ACTTE|nr:yrdC domain-containing protein, mitochondrial-like [Actinia tenebrosa]
MKYRVFRLQENESENHMSKLIEEAVKSLKLGHVIAIPTDTIYGIAALAQSTTAVEQLYEIKERHQEKPIAICVSDVEDVKKWGKVTVCDEILHDLLPGPVTLVFERTKELNPGLNSGTKLVGIRIPNHKFVQQLAKACKEPIALTSANKSAGMSSLKIEEFKTLWPKLNLIVDGGLLGQSQACRQGSTVINLSVPEEFSIIRDGSAYQHTLSILEVKYGLINADDR